MIWDIFICLCARLQYTQRPVGCNILLGCCYSAHGVSRARLALSWHFSCYHKSLCVSEFPKTLPWSLRRLFGAQRLPKCARVNKTMTTSTAACLLRLLVNIYICVQTAPSRPTECSPGVTAAVRVRLCDWQATSVSVLQCCPQLPKNVVCRR